MWTVVFVKLFVNLFIIQYTATERAITIKLHVLDYAKFVAHYDRLTYSKQGYPAACR